MSEEIKDNGTGAEEGAQEKKFTQSEVDELIRNRLAREAKKYPSEDELTAC